jgi:predicted molibdopterin-dependent oxidoreductase YjgC
VGGLIVRGEEVENVKWEVKDNKLIIEIDLAQEFGLSKSGKTVTIASTKGNQQIEGTDAVIGLNVYKYPAKG